jgi:hypothetical protein
MKNLNSEPTNETASSKQIDANRRNAQKSTGPKTPAGRAASKMNALKHGIFSKEVLVRGLNINESSRDLNALHERFWQEHNPVGPAEEMLVDQMVTAYWRWRRVLRAESGEIALSVDAIHWARSRLWHQELQVVHWNECLDPICRMKDTAMGNRMLAGWLREVRARVEQEGELSEAAIKIPCNGKPNIVSVGLEELRLRLSQNAEGADPANRKEENKKQALSYIDRELSLIQWGQGKCEKREAAEEEARQAAAVLPAPEVLDKIMRYESTLQRQFYRALAQLERMQRMRQGEAVPAPMMMEVSERA